ncbi:c-type cytochrome [Steroidobacter cummioxidans]|uniref:c-type cytochrome n=1 Tax=Steroidobacter cummioxidans TaxID=1803913 RepID=UPI001F4E97EC|nr:cytochrome c [Steroidobacter cummioxidans]
MTAPFARARRVLVIAASLLMIPVVAAKADGPSIERGEYLARAGNCGSCHTAVGGPTMAGGVAFETPFGKIYSTNITPDPQTGIGNWTEAQFAQALRKGVRPDGTHLYPVFPYTAYTKVTDEDATALFAYLKSMPAVSATPSQNEMSFPFNQRWLMGLWKALFFNEGPYQPVAAQSAEWNRGAYLVEGLGHCSACHSPRNVLGAERSSAAMTGGTYLDRVPSGEVRPWSAPNLTSSSTGLGEWSVEDIAAYLKKGRNAHVSVSGPMNEVIMNSTQHLTDEDVRAMSVYLKSVPANDGDVTQPASGSLMSEGSLVYDVHCGTCHLPTGEGSADTGTALARVSPLVQANDPASLINIILYGPPLPEPELPAKWKRMEPFADKLTDEEIAQVASFVRGSWNNKAGAVTAEQVAKQR